MKLNEFITQSAVLGLQASKDGKNGIPAQDVAFRELIKSVTYWGNHRMIRMLKAYTTAFYDYKFLSN